MEQAIFAALLWPIRDVPRIFSISSSGFAPAMPALIELAAATGIMVFMPKGRLWSWFDVLLAYGAGATISFLFNRV